MTSLALRLVCLLVAAVVSEPTPARVPKVYNALITSNQNLEPSKAYPVYQPVVHDTAFVYPFQTPLFFGGDFPLTNGLAPGSIPRGAIKPGAPPVPPAPPVDLPQPKPSDTPEEAKNPDNSEPPKEGEEKKDGLPPTPSTESPIPLNEFGLPSQVFPLGRFDPAFNGFTQVGSIPQFTYPSYPGFRFYDPYDPFSYNPYANLPPPLYRPITNVLTPGPALIPPKGPAGPAAVPAPAPEQPTDGSSPPPEPSDLNVLNYASKDPAIPNVPPPPLPSGGLKSDKSE